MSDAAIGPKFTPACSCTSGTYNLQCPIEHHRNVAVGIKLRIEREASAATGPLLDRLVESKRALHMEVWNLLSEMKKRYRGYHPTQNSTIDRLARLVCFDWDQT